MHKTKRAIPLIAIAILAIAGAGLLVTSKAAVLPVASFEAENATLIAPSTQVADTTASNGSLIKFSAPTNDVKSLLQKYRPGVTHEAFPHGVPTNYDWRSTSILKNIDPPDAEMTYLNIRGAVYVDETNSRPSNTRVEIINCVAYGLVKTSNQWEKFIDLSPGKINGRLWREDFSTPGDPSLTNIRTETDGGKSVINLDGYSLHYFNSSLNDLVQAGTKYRHFVTACSTRLVLNSPTGPDDRANSHYIIDVGNDWKRSDNTCTVNSSGATLCYAVGAGVFIKPTKDWRRVVYSTMSQTDLDTYPLPPEAMFLNPDGSFGDG